MEALASDGVSASARQHLLECEVCRDAVLVDEWMTALASAPLEERVLPDPTIIILKAQLMQQKSAFVSLAAAMSWGQTIGFGVLALCWALLLSWKWAAVEALVAAFGSRGMAWSAATAFAAQMPFVLTVVLLACATVAMAFQSVLLEE